MFRTASFALLIATAGAANALVLTEDATPGDQGETFHEENAEFVGVPVVGVNGGPIGTVVDAKALPGQDRMIYVEFHEGFSDSLSGMMLRLDGMWETDGVLQTGQTAAEVAEFVEQYAAENPQDLHSAAVLDQ
ncbi:hypothetical protein ACUXV3_05435 [Roseobacteraceae bacterium NS-SX3]